MSEKFSLKWNDFHSNVSKSFGLFRNEEYLHDVTLVSDDHNKVAAHKLVLSASSEYFRDIFKNNQDRSYLLLCLDGINSEDLKNIMDYIYDGEVQIYQENIDRFLAVAQKLKLEGLIGNQKEEIVETETTMDDSMTPLDELSENLASELDPNSTKTKIDNPVRKALVLSNAETLSEISEEVNKYLEECSDGNFKCTFCGKTSTGQRLRKGLLRQSMKRHIETHIDGLTYTCPICQKTARSSSALIIHKNRHHK